MRLFRNFLILLIISCSTAAGIPAQTSKTSDPVIIQNVELLRHGRQISVRLLTDSPPVYIITENLASGTLVIKFSNARIGFSDGRNERLFNDPQLAGIRFSAIDGDSWAQFKLLKKDLSYSVSSLTGQNGIQIDFRPSIQIEPLLYPPEDAAYQLVSIKFDAGNTDFTRLTFGFTKPAKFSETGSVPEDRQPPRIFLLENTQIGRAHV